jgi:hypothetical protein
MVDLKLLLLCASVIIAANVVAKRVFALWRTMHVLGSQFPSPPIGNWLVGHATPSMMASQTGFRWMSETTVKYGKTVLLRLLYRPVSRWLSYRIENFGRLFSCALCITSCLLPFAINPQAWEYAPISYCTSFGNHDDSSSGSMSSGLKFSQTITVSLAVWCTLLR